MLEDSQDQKSILLDFLNIVDLTVEKADFPYFIHLRKDTNT